MAEYHANSPSAIKEIFTQEGDALGREGFKAPELDSMPEEYREMLSRLAVQDKEPEVING